MTEDEMIMLFKNNRRPIIRSMALMWEYGQGLDLCKPLYGLAVECIADSKQQTFDWIDDTHTTPTDQFSLEVGLFNLMHNCIEPGITLLKASADTGNTLAAVALWVMDMKLDCDLLSGVNGGSDVLKAISRDKCDIAFQPVMNADSRDSDKLWDHVLERLNGASETKVYARSTLNLILGNYTKAFRDLIRCASRMGRISLWVDVAALQMWSGLLAEAENRFRFAAAIERKDLGSPTYHEALGDYIIKDVFGW
ncbi:hypothetical protein ACFL6U_25285 [Planctomycetota bacterium]